MSPSSVARPELWALSLGERGVSVGLNSKEIALISVFASIWMVAQTLLGPIIGRFSIGPISLHGVVNRVVGWMLMLILAEFSSGFGRVSAMSLVAALGTRIIRLSPLIGLVIGVGYALGGLTFDALFFVLPAMNLGGRSRKIYVLAASAISGSLAMVPYLFFRFSVLGPDAFLALTPIYALSTVKGILFSVAGSSLALSILPRVRSMLNPLS